MMKNAKHYIVDKNTDEVVHGPYETEQAAKTAALHYDWFDPEQHEVAHGMHELRDVDDENDDFGGDGTEFDDQMDDLADSDDSNDTNPFMHGGNFNHDDETESFSPIDFDLDGDIDDHNTEDHSDAQEHGSHGHFIMHPSCDLPIAGPFNTEDQANEFKIIGVPSNTIIVVGMLSSDGNFYKHD